MRLPVLSFRTRLTISYAVLTAVLLTIVAVGLTALALEFTVHPVSASLEEMASATDRLVKAHWSAADRELIALVVRQPSHSNVRLSIRAVRPFGPPPGPQGVAFPKHLFGVMVGLRPRFVRLHQGDVFIEPEWSRLDVLLRTYLIALGTALIVTLASSWAIGRRITSKPSRR